QRHRALRLRLVAADDYQGQARAPALPRPHQDRPPKIQATPLSWKIRASSGGQLGKSRRNSARSVTFCFCRKELNLESSIEQLMATLLADWVRARLGTHPRSELRSVPCRRIPRNEKEDNFVSTGCRLPVGVEKSAAERRELPRRAPTNDPFCVRPTLA